MGWGRSDGACSVAVGGEEARGVFPGPEELIRRGRAAGAHASEPEAGIRASDT